MKDIIIVGAGTAGMSAAIYAVRAGKTVLVLEAAAYGGQIINAADVENYPGIKHISGFDFANGLYEQARELGAEFGFEKVEGIENDPETGRKLVRTAKTVHEARAVILATGARNRPLGLPEEKELVGKGISYCATCDGMFYRNKVVAVNGGGNTAVEDAQFLSNVCKKVYIIHRRDEFRADVKEVEKLRQKENVEFLLNSTVTKLHKDEKRLCGITVRNKLGGEEKTVELSGLFIAIGQQPDNAAFSNVVSLDDKGYIIAGEDCDVGNGIFVAGDCRTKTVRQLTTAASDGATAALAACAYI